jgi:hypothetical protein
MPAHSMRHSPPKPVVMGLLFFFVLALLFSKGFLFWVLPFFLFWMFSTKARGGWGHGCGMKRDDVHKRKNDEVIVVQKRKNDNGRYIETFDGEQLEVIGEDDPPRYV